ncbi:enoyl-CoA hydratase/isomerase family protein [Actinomadura madurae]|uniref:enoyl-CoA hydratase/isomerase family protein n=1 Tax=Actinomadura madurae TaxID=1993 RepID=UPI002026B8C2|nr:enoyl-CoA hydratase/isomerase family protein [Actinomadura madurae]MCP9955380.1 enoyl-CoA hydratase/isomerase family protein [Actinomadura madurae]MCP9972121.1 enoyl-CoA hydratase/isomerase family protein [Actinomadura madurae]MCP9984620.1 enoyl-CoA hydratase/isomerase family protein [Actinomadura madurae]MCQ0003830.1 enoyl-CoA hydratase/isomerase family protein [Actinomadura madurae]MCQ0020813.1 enoyl-CoA hydratase/isomerase family protein [Actinomadura madurae]
MTERDQESSPDAASILVADVGEGIVRITLNRPEKRNALDARARQGFLDALDAARGRAKVIILAGAGGTFSAGMDLNQLAGGDTAQEDELNASWLRVQEEIRRHPAIVIAAACGYALGGGSTLINASDLAVVAEDAQIGMPEIGFGFYPGLAGPAAQLRLGPKHAAWLVLTAKRIDGRTAVDWGMANIAVGADEVDGAALDLARHIARFDAVALEWSKKALWHIPMHVNEWRAALEFGAYTNSQIHARTDGHRQALDDFTAGRPNPGQGAA